MKTILALLLSALACLALAIDSQAGPYSISLQTDPAIVPVGKAEIVVRLAQAGKPVDGATVKVLARMPSMPMGEREQVATPVPGQSGSYSAPVSFAMAGRYETTVAIDGPAGSATVKIPLETGRNTAEGSGGFPWTPVIVVAIALVGTVWVLRRMRLAGMKPNFGGLLSAGTIGALIVIAVVLGIAVWAVNHLRRPGSMTPLESQAMEMNTPAPPGAAPVMLASVTRGAVNGSVRYTGQAVGFNEQDVFARVTGTLVRMPPYVGDKVVRGQVLARLDTTQTGPQAADKAAGVDAARQGVNAAEADYHKSLADVSLATAEQKQFEANLLAAQSDLAAAQQDRISADAAVAAAKSDIVDAEAKVSAAQADATYWAAEIKRAESLYQADVYSKDEYQKEKAEADKATAALAQARQGVSSAQARLRASQAGVAKSIASIQSARHKVEAAKGELATKTAEIHKSVADAESYRTRIGVAQSGVRQAQAQFAGAAATQGYATVISPIDGVVVSRNLTQGTLVQEGQAILRIAQISPIRVQANVPAADLAKIQIGAAVTVRLPDGASFPSKVSSVQPAVDPSARTGIVEALLSNADRKVKPGQFVDMQIATGASREATLVPSDAVQSGTDGGSFVWLAEPSGDQYTVRMAPVTVGDSDGARTAVLTGLTQGQQVVTSGFVNLREGGAVRSADSLSAPMVKVTESGFEPSVLELPNGATEVTFLRTTDTTCAKQVVFSETGISKDLPLNQPVKVTLPPGKSTDYACGMDMLTGKVIRR